MRPIRIGIVMDPIASIQPKKDTTLAFMLEAQSRGWQIAQMTLNDLYLNNGQAEGYLRYLLLTNDSEHWFEIEREVYEPLHTLDIILMRKDPPFDMEYVMATYVLERAEYQGVLVVNKPRSLRDVNEKVFTSWFPQCCAPALLTRSKNAVKKFLESHQKIVVKPTDKMGGQSVFIIEKGDPNTNVILEEVTHFESKFIQVQAYIPEIEQGGDKRILLIDGSPVQQGVARIPSGGDHRGNLVAGAHAKGFELSERDRWICSEIGPVLKEKGLLFVGIDIIGDYLTEINVTSPTGVREIDALFDISVSSMFFDTLLKLLDGRNR